jgi:putative DNA primase/helicase
MPIDLRSWKTSWSAESATLAEANKLKNRLVESWREGGKPERELARLVAACRKRKRCGSPECPVCERRRCRQAKDKRIIPAAAPEARCPSPTVILVRTSEIIPERIEWLWPGIIASGRVTGLVGYPGVGKSQVGIDITATVSTRRLWPGGIGNGKAGHVVILSAEDGPTDTIAPRLIAAGADCSRVLIVKAVRKGDGLERAFDLTVDLDRLEKEYGLRQVRLLLIDPVSSYLRSTTGKRVNRNSAGDVRTVQDRLGEFAAQHNLAVLAVSHLNKSSGTRAITRIMGSLEWVAGPRAVFLVTEEAGTDRRLFLPLKNNLAPDRIGYAFRIQNRVVADGINTSAIVWDQEPVTITAEEALAAAAKKTTSGAIDFLQQALSEGPVDQSEIVRLGREAGFTEKTLRNAREKLGVKPTKEGFGPEGKWVWMPAGGATLLTLVVDNEANKKTPADSDPPGATGGSGANRDLGSHDVQDVGTAEPGKPEGGPEEPDGGDAA